MGVRLARGSNTERPWRETCGTDRNPSVGNRVVWSVGEMAWGAGASTVSMTTSTSTTVPEHATAALVMPPPTPPSGHAGSPSREAQASRRAAHNLAPLRPHCENVGEPLAYAVGGDGVPVQGSWGRLSITTWEGKPGRQRPPDDPTGGEAGRSPASRTSLRHLRQTGVREEASAPAAVHPAHARHSQSTRRTPGSQLGEACQRTCPSVPGSRSIPGEFTQTLPMLPAAGVAVRPPFRPSEELCSIPQAKGRDGTETLQHSLVRTLASRTTDSVCPSR